MAFLLAELGRVSDAPLSFLEKGVVNIFKPVQGAFYNLGSSLNQITNLNEIVKENSKLKDELGRLSIDYVKLLDMQSENEYLRKELDFVREGGYQFKVADVIGRLPDNQQMLIINQGSRAGLEEGFAATVGQGVVVGKVFKVEADIAYVMLLSDSQSSLAVSLVNSANTSGLLKGQGLETSLLMDLIPLNQELNQGDLVISSGLEEKIPRGFLVGEVSQVDNTVGQIFKQAKIIPAFAFQNIQSLTIILRK